MKQKHNFWESLEAYGWKVAGRSPLPYPWIGMGLVVMVVIASAANVKTSVVGARSEREVIERAAGVGDYQTARELFERLQILDDRLQVLGAESALEELVYPEEKLAREIARWEGKLAEYLGNREIMRGLAGLYEQAGETDKAAELREQVRKLDPNGE